jgi:uncharacterized protein (TIGR02001 family)
MMKVSVLFGTLSLLAAAPSAWALEASVTPTVASDYDFRGISLTGLDPAYQLSLDVATESGFSGNIFASNVDFGEPDVDIEIDYTLGWNGSADSFDWDTGIAYYSYPNGSDLNYPETWVGISKAFTEGFSLDGRIWYSWDYAGVDESGTYVETNATYGLPIGNIDLGLHAGYSSGNYWDSVYGQSYFDYSVSLSKSIARLDFAIALIDGSDLPDEPGTDLNSTDRKVVLSVSTTLPWE